MSKPLKCRNKPAHPESVEPLTLVVPMPPSTNSLFRNVPGRGRALTSTYRKWIEEAGWQLASQPKWSFPGDVILTITVGPRKAGADASNYIKAPEDLLVRHGIIIDDSYVYWGEYGWGDVKGCQIDVRPASGLRPIGDITRDIVEKARGQR